MGFKGALKISLLLVSIAAASPGVFAQGKPRPQDKEAGKDRADAQAAASAEAALRARARALAASTADEALKWDDRATAVKVLSRAADLLWEDNPERSREWLTRAWELTNEVARENAESATSRFRSNSPRANARASVLAVAGRRDRQLADRLLEELAAEKEQSQYESQRGVFDDRTARSQQLLSMALANVEREPALAASLGEQSLIDGISFQFQSLLLNLQGRDPAAANRLLDAALNRLAGGFTNASEGLVIASYFFTPGRVAGAGGGGVTTMAVGTQTPALPRTPAEIDPNRTRRFLSIMQQALLAMPAPVTTPNPAQAAQEFITLATSLAGGFRRYAPELWLPIQQRMVQVLPDRAAASPEQRVPSDVHEKLRSARAAGADEKELNRVYVEGLEELAEKETDPLARKLAYVQAALATEAEDLERGRRIALKIEEEELRRQVVSFLFYRAALLALEKGKLEEAVGVASEAGPLQRALVLITAAQRMSAAQTEREKDEVQAVNRKLRARSLLSDAETLLKRNDLPADALRVRLGLVAALAPLDAAHALAVFESVVAAINKTESFDATDLSAPRLVGLDGFSSQTSVPRIRGGYGLKDAVTPLVRMDFESIVQVAAKLSAPAARGVCLLDIAQVVLDSKPDKQPQKKQAPPAKQGS